MESIDFTADHRNLISTANKIFGEGKWNHSVAQQTLDYVEAIGAKCSVGCVSFVKVQLENGTFHEDVGYYSAEESTKGLSIHNARIGSAVNGLRRVLLSFGDKIEKELQLQKQINLEQTGDIQKNAIQSSVNKHMEKKSNVPIQEPTTILERKNAESNKNKGPVQIVKEETTATKLSSPIINSSLEIFEDLDEDKDNLVTIQNDKTNITEQEQELSAKERQRMERKRKQMEKQMEFKNV
ncbi:DNA repair protein RAD52 homolog isoform X2 [Nylanderia fulva]|nr:DNA repair protein RAD52 homolog isoform X2 [Nylanderia fulva]XP_029174296.1 DNA repair protein RAD52 homolog isoform X2 [Nylanderia fulva]